MHPYSFLTTTSFVHRILIPLCVSLLFQHNFFFFCSPLSSYLWPFRLLTGNDIRKSGWRVQLCLTKFTVNWYFIIKLQCGWFTLSGGLIVSVHFMLAWVEVFWCRFAVKCVHYAFECIKCDEGKKKYWRYSSYFLYFSKREKYWSHWKAEGFWWKNWMNTFLYLHLNEVFFFWIYSLIGLKIFSMKRFSHFGKMCIAFVKLIFFFLLCFSSIYIAWLMVFCGKFMHSRGCCNTINSKPTSMPLQNPEICVTWVVVHLPLWKTFKPISFLWHS